MAESLDMIICIIISALISTVVCLAFFSATSMPLKETPCEIPPMNAVLAKQWNEWNQDINAFPIDNCSNAVRQSSTDWLIHLGVC